MGVFCSVCNPPGHEDHDPINLGSKDSNVVENKKSADETKTQQVSEPTVSAIVKV